MQNLNVFVFHSAAMFLRQLIFRFTGFVAPFHFQNRNTIKMFIHSHISLLHASIIGLGSDQWITLISWIYRLIPRSKGSKDTRLTILPHLQFTVYDAVSDMMHN